MATAKTLLFKNRFLTFLNYHHLPQRKTGLFKKAYELGVLCSVDVAVIIFGTPHSYFYLYCPSTILFSSLTERKHGHPDKLFQYCSTDIDSLVQRQIRVQSLNIFSYLSSSPCFSLTESVIFVRPMTSPEEPAYLAWTIWAKTMTTVMPTTLQLLPTCVMMG